ncbi:porin PorA family protein [Corynebacterium lubricantis]|uniref:porin PorA family protein n=1 Tax=Corynebacterium lubricantis TaxID=541095 RepID=UPI0003700452|nr:porin PorA family protein [Corynebacterium lubricantis]
MALRDQAPTKRGIIITAVIAVVAILVGSAAPPLVVLFLKLLPNDVQVDYTMTSESASVLDIRALLDDDEARLIDGPATIERTSATSKTDKFMETNVDSDLSVSINGDVVTELVDYQRLNRDSAFPVVEPVAHQSLTVPALGDATVDTPPHTREGLRYFFPFATERRSYQFSDEIVPETVPLDYVDPVERHGLRTYKFHTQLPTTQLFQEESLSTGEAVAQQFGLSAAEATTFDDYLTGPAQEFFSPEEMEQFSYTENQLVTMAPYYTAERIFFIEPKSGIVLDEYNAVHIYLAANNPQAREMAEQGLFNPTRTVFSGDFALDQASQEAQLDRARPIVNQLRALQVVSLFANVITFLALAALIYQIVRRRIARSRALTDEQ